VVVLLARPIRPVVSRAIGPEGYASGRDDPAEASGRPDRGAAECDDLVLWLDTGEQDAVGGVRDEGSGCDDPAG